MVKRFSISGFTLVEIVVTTAVLIFVMSAVWSAGFLRASDFSVMINQEKLRLLATRAKSMTINSVFGAHTDSCGYGVRVERDKAFIFLDHGICGEGNNRIYDLGEEVTGSINTITLREGITFASSTGETAEVLFIPPDPRVVINGNEAVSEVTFEVRSPTGASKKVIINKQGLINLQN
ncbi:MAG: type II secretion system protein [Parcubacteria group bacterium]